MYIYIYIYIYVYMYMQRERHIILHFPDIPSLGIAIWFRTALSIALQGTPRPVPFVPPFKVPWDRTFLYYL